MSARGNINAITYGDLSRQAARLQYTTIYYYILPYTTIYYYILLYTTIYYYTLLNATIYYYILLYTTTYYYILLYTTIHYYILLYSMYSVHTPWFLWNSMQNVLECKSPACRAVHSCRVYLRLSSAVWRLPPLYLVSSSSSLFSPISLETCRLVLLRRIQ